MAKVKFLKEGVEIDVPEGVNLRDFCVENNLKLYIFPENIVNCRGRGFCGLCRIKVDHPEKLSPLTEKEKCTVAVEGPQYRLACQCSIAGNGELQIITGPRRKCGWMDHPVYHSLMKEEEKIYGF
ncbi:MAG: 2Fe-2S iron-sulfur cluster-binding protein [Candidatus Anammoxibacter sp.]